MFKKIKLKIKYFFSKKIEYVRFNAENLLEASYFKEAGFFTQLKLNISLVFIQATTTSVKLFRLVYLMAFAYPLAIYAQIYVVLQYFFKVYVPDCILFYPNRRVIKSYVIQKKIPEQYLEDIEYYLNLKVFLESFVYSYEFFILMCILAFINISLYLAFIRSDFLYYRASEDVPSAETQFYDHVKSQVLVWMWGDIQYINEFKKVEKFVKAEAFLYMLRLDVKVHQKLLTEEEATIEYDKIILNLEKYLTNVANILLQIREYDALILKKPSLARSKKYINLRYIYDRLYDFQTSEDIARIYDSLYACWRMWGEEGIIYYFEVEFVLERPFKPELPKKPLVIAKRFSENQKNIRKALNKQPKSIYGNKKRKLSDDNYLDLDEADDYFVRNVYKKDDKVQNNLKDTKFSIWWNSWIHSMGWWMIIAHMIFYAKKRFKHFYENYPKYIDLFFSKIGRIFKFWRKDK